jgi:hypothetical protein
MVQSVTRREGSRRPNRGVNPRYNPEEYSGLASSRDNIENCEPSARPFLLPAPASSATASLTSGKS